MSSIGKTNGIFDEKKNEREKRQIQTGKLLENAIYA